MKFLATPLPIAGMRACVGWQVPIHPNVAYDGDSNNFDAYPEVDLESSLPPTTNNATDMALFDDF